MITPGKTANFPELVDPPDGHPEYAGIAYDYLLGKAGTAHRYLLRPDGTVNLYWFSGDPVTGTGDLPQNFVLGNFRPQDLRILVNTGPFALARGDTQEVVAAVLLARGRDHLHSVRKLKEHARYIRAMFENDFRFLNIPSQPSRSDVREDVVPTELVLRQNYPNPFNPGTTLEYELAEPAGVTIRVLDCFGREIRTLVQAQHSSGVHSVNWDGTDQSGRQLATGVYYARLEALRLDGTMRIFTRKMILVR